jgi:hypothetical protein
MVFGIVAGFEPHGFVGMVAYNRTMTAKPYTEKQGQYRLRIRREDTKDGLTPVFSLQ